MYQIFLYASISLIAFGLGMLFERWRIRRISSGVIHVTTTPDRTLYTLELLDYPEILMFKKVVVFDVDTSSTEDRRD